MKDYLQVCTGSTRWSSNQDMSVLESSAAAPVGCNALIGESHILRGAVKVPLVRIGNGNPNEVEPESDLESLSSDLPSIPLSPLIPEGIQQPEIRMKSSSETPLCTPRTVPHTRKSQTTNDASCRTTAESAASPVDELPRVIRAVSSLPTETPFEAEPFLSCLQKDSYRVYHPAIRTLKRPPLQERKPQSLAAVRRYQGGPERYRWTMKNPRHCQPASPSQHEPELCPVRFPAPSVPCPSTFPWSDYTVRASHFGPTLQENGPEATTTPSSTRQYRGCTPTFATASARLASTGTKAKEHGEREEPKTDSRPQQRENSSSRWPLPSTHLIRHQESCVQEERGRFNSSKNQCSTTTDGRHVSERHLSRRAFPITARPAGTARRIHLCRRDYQQEKQSSTSNPTANISRKENVPLPTRKIQHQTTAQARSDSDFVPTGTIRSSNVGQIDEPPRMHQCIRCLLRKADCTANFEKKSRLHARQAHSPKNHHSVGDDGLSHISNVAYSSFAGVSPKRLHPCRGCCVATSLSEDCTLKQHLANTRFIEARGPPTKRQRDTGLRLQDPHLSFPTLRRGNSPDTTEEIEGRSAPRSALLIRLGSACTRECHQKI